jgi:flagellum-specific peptidoglycan hydrolase FlgJ
MQPNDFIAAISPAARASMIKTGVPASFSIAQAALESSWGKSGLAVIAHNLFGVKADRGWSGDTWVQKTREFVRGEWVIQTATWRKYSDWQGSFDDHADFFLKNHRYADCFKCKDGVSFTLAVQKAGYATDPNYAKLITAIIRQYDLTHYDGV